MTASSGRPYKVGELPSIQYSAALLIREHASVGRGSGLERHRKGGHKRELSFRAMTAADGLPGGAPSYSSDSSTLSSQPAALVFSK